VLGAAVCIVIAVAFDPKLLQQPASDLGVVSAGSAMVQMLGLLYVWSLLLYSTPSCCSRPHQTWEW
jgi:hypothetical protein